MKLDEWMELSFTDFFVAFSDEKKVIYESEWTLPKNIYLSDNGESFSY